MIEYPQYIDLSTVYIKNKISEFLYEDMPNGDLTTETLITEKDYAIAEIEAVDKLIFAGNKIIPLCFDANCNVNMYKKDGELVAPGEIIAKITGPTKTILSHERVMLNLIQRLCGIASKAKEFVDITSGFNIKILDTRKMTPGLRLFEKYAVAIGGAYNHRLNLSEGMLIKDNHIFSAGSVKITIEKALSSNINRPIELEVDNLEQIIEALKYNIDGFLLDNMSPKIIKKAVSLIRKSDKDNHKYIEASGGITENNIVSYLDTGIDAISIGAITHSALNKDIRLTLVS